MASWKDSVRALVPSNVSLAACAVAQDGITLVAADRVLLIGQAAAKDNGIYTVGIVAGGNAPLTRATDANTSALMGPETALRVSEGSVYAHTEWALTTPGPITLGTSSLTFAKILVGAAIPAPALVATSNIALTGVVTVDGVMSNTVTGAVLCTAQTTASENGYWTPNAGGVWTRPLYYNSDAAVAAALGQLSAVALGGTLNKGQSFFALSGATLAGPKVWFPARPMVEIDVCAQPWGIKADGTDETAKMKAVFDYCWTLGAAYLSSMLLLPPRAIRVTEYLKGSTNVPQGCGVPLIPYMSIRGCGTWGSGFIVGNATPIHGMLGNAGLNSGGGCYASYRDFFINNTTCSWHYGGQQYWSPSTSYASTPIGTMVRPVKPSNVMLKLTSTRGTSGPYRPIGELYSIGASARMLGTAATGHATVFRITTAGQFGFGAQLQVSTDGGNTWGASVTPDRLDYVVVNLSAYLGITGAALGAGVAAKIANGAWAVNFATTTNGAGFAQPAVGATVTIPLAATAGLVPSRVIAVAGSGLYEVQSVTAGVSVVGKLWVAYPGGTGGAGRAVTQVYPVQPRVEVLSAPTAANQTLDLTGFTGGPLGLRNFGNYRVTTPGTLDPSAYTTALMVATPGPVGGTVTSAFTDVTYGGVTIRVHGGVQGAVPDILYFTPIFGWSMESTRALSASNATCPGTFVDDSASGAPGTGNIWEVVEAPDAIRLDGVGFAGFYNVTTYGGNCGYAISQSEVVEVEGNFFLANWSMAGVFISNGDLRLGEGGQFANVITIGGNGTYYGDGYGIIDSGGLSHNLAGQFQLCPAGWCYLAGIYGGKVHAGYVETGGGFMYNTAYLTRAGYVQGVKGLNLTTGYAGSIGGNYFLYCYGAIFNFDGVIAGGAISGFGGLSTCNVTGTGSKFPGGYLTDSVPAYGHVTDLASGVTWRGYTTETQRTRAVTSWGANNIDMALSSSDLLLSGGPSAHGWLLHSLAPLPAGLREGQIVRITNATGFWGVIKNNSGSGTAGYRIFTPGGDDLYLPAASGGVFSFVELFYFGVVGSPGWYVRSHTSTDQTGVATLVSGVVTVTAAIKASSRILVTTKGPSGTSLTTEYAALASDRTNGVLGSFKITALLAAGTINAADNSTIDWLVKN